MLSIARIRDSLLILASLAVCIAAFEAIAGAQLRPIGPTSPAASGTATVSAASVYNLASTTFNMGPTSHDVVVLEHIDCQSTSTSNYAGTDGVGLDTASTISNGQAFVMYGQAGEFIAGPTDVTRIIDVTPSSGTHTYYCLLGMGTAPSPAATCACEIVVLL